MRVSGVSARVGVFVVKGTSRSDRGRARAKWLLTRAVFGIQSPRYATFSRSSDRRSVPDPSNTIRPFSSTYARSATRSTC